MGAGTIGIIAGAPNLGAIRLIGTAHTGAQSRVSLAPWFGTRGSTGLAARVEF